MKEEDRLVEKFGRKGPWTVPDGYFDAMRSEIEASLPPYPAKPKPQDLSAWQRIKPYVYLAAMFAGIWCMMQVFHRAGGVGSMSIENPPAQIAAAMSDPEVSEMYLLGQSFSDEELIDEVSANYDNIEDFEEDFGYTIEPKYDRMKL